MSVVSHAIDRSSILDDSGIPATPNPPPFFAVLVVGVGGSGDGVGSLKKKRKKRSFLLRGYKHQFNLRGIHCTDLFIDFVVLISKGSTTEKRSFEMCVCFDRVWLSWGDPMRLTGQN